MGSNPTGEHVCLSVVCCQVEVSARGRSLVRRSPTDCGVSECHREASTVGGTQKMSCSKQGRVDGVKQVEQKHDIPMEKSNKSLVGQCLGQPLFKSRCRWLLELMKTNRSRGWRLDSSTSEWKSVVCYCARTFELCSW